MLVEMQPFTTFMNVESTRSYIDDLYSSDPEKCLASIVCIKNSVIGSNRQKESVIAQGIVPRLLQLLEDKNTKLAVRVEATVTIGSLAKGTNEHIEILINSGTIQLLLDIVEENEPRLIDACLCCLRTLSHLDCAASQNKYDIKRLQKLLTFAGPGESLQRQSCVASILGSACKTPAEQNELCSIGAPNLLASLLSVQNSSVRIPVLTCLASMCWNNQSVANVVVNTAYKDVKIPNYLATLINRDRPIEMQLEAARCLTNLHRAGAIPAYDPIITYRTLPCLVHLCQIEHSEPHRASAANTLAYLTEVDSDLQQIAAISNQLVSALVHLLSCCSVAARQAAFRAFASLAANDEDIRKRIIDTKCLMDSVLEGLDDENENIRLAAVRCLHSLSRSVQQLRTTFQDHSVWRPLMTLLTGENFY
ncbi:armadillo repeat-containing protein 8 [Asbolus verrucosus]|uniref:Armadillo repeat-containing protein 8 n=1 Tax=Asbolus verrucosus TaxID=1661398 RepID=A0A482W764_ASBVE|nr:armadillo repeat-containing protein 8 [Asbolus verrucosus]